MAGHAQAYVAAVQGLQQQLAAFAAPVPGNTTAVLAQEVSALQQELARAVSSLLDPRTTSDADLWAAPQQLKHAPSEQHAVGTLCC